MLLNTNNYRKSEVQREPHNLFPDFSENALFDGPDKSFQIVNFELPYPVQEPLPIPLNTKDPLKQLLLEKKEFEDKVKNAQRKKLLRSVEDIPNFPVEDAEYRYMSKGLLETYQCKDPDEDFRSDYNLYYTNGILDAVHLNGIQYLVWPKNYGRIHFLNVADNKDSFSIEVTTDAPICSLRAYSFDKYAYVLLRLKCAIIILQISDPANFFTIYENNFNKQVIDAKVDAQEICSLGIINVNNEFSIQHVKSKIKLFKPKNKKSANDFGVIQFEFLEDSKVILMNKFVVQLFDYKSKTILKTFDPKLMACNQLCNLKVLNNTLFLSSRHYVIKTELNDLEDFSTYAHTMGFAPLFMDMLNSYLCLANHFQDSKIMFAGKVIFGLPNKVPGIQQTLREAVLRNARLVLEGKLSERLDFAIAGLKLVEFLGKVFIFFVNSLGELFQQQISYISVVDNSQAIEKLCTWIEKLNKPQSPLYVTNFAEMGDTFLFLNRPLPKVEKYSRSGKENLNFQKFLAKFEPLYCVENLKSTFAKGFLDIWEESEDEEASVEDAEVPYYEKVNEWMENQDSEPETSNKNEFKS